MMHYEVQPWYFWVTTSTWAMCSLLLPLFSSIPVRIVECIFALVVVVVVFAVVVIVIVIVVCHHVFIA